VFNDPLSCRQPLEAPWRPGPRERNVLFAHRWTARQQGTLPVQSLEVRLTGAAGEQWMTFYYEPAGKPVEFKVLADESQLFGH
jgi:extradiol dioxygenase family protein